MHHAERFHSLQVDPIFEVLSVEIKVLPTLRVKNIFLDQDSNHIFIETTNTYKMSDQEATNFKQGFAVSFCRSLWCERIKLVLATCAVSLLLLVVVIGIASGYCVLKVFPLVNFIILFVCLSVLATVEGLHYAVVSVEKWDMEQYRERFPRALRCHALVNTPEKVKKFLVGRQFFTIFVVFLLAQVTSFPTIPHNFAGLPKIMIIILLQTGLPGVAMTLTVGQLVS